MSSRRKGFSAASFRPQWGSDVLAGFVNAVVCVPNGLAMGTLAGVSPVSGLYAATVGPLTGSLLTSTHLMIVTTTSAAAIAAGQAVASVPEGQRSAAMFLLTLITGLFLIAFAVLKAGRLVKYIPFSVMQGFMFGVAAILVLDQFPAMVGYAPQSGNSVIALFETLGNVSAWQFQATIVGLVALVLVAGIARTAISNWSNIIALVIPTGAALLLGWTAQQQVGDVSAIPRGFPPFAIPDVSALNLEILIGAFSLAAIITVQASGIASTLKNPDDSRQNFNQDILAQGGANVAVGLLSGIPVGASVGQSVFNRAAGARTRMALVFCGLWLIAFLLVLGPIIELVPMAVLGALMVFAGFGAMNFGMVRSIARTGWLPLIALTVTLVLTVLVSVQAAVLAGVLLSFILNSVQSSSDVLVRAMQIDSEGRVLEVAPPEKLPANGVIALVVYGDLFFAGAKVLEDSFPGMYEVERPAVVLRLRGQTHTGATLVDVISTYANRLDEAGGRLFLSGVSDTLMEQLERSGRLRGDKDSHDDGLVALHAHQEELGLSTSRAIHAARQWLADTRAKDGEGGTDSPQPYALRMVPIDADGRLVRDLARVGESPAATLARIERDSDEQQDRDEAQDAKASRAEVEDLSGNATVAASSPDIGHNTHGERDGHRD